MRQIVYLDPNGTITMTLRCDWCHDGRVEGEVIGYCRHTGAPLFATYPCDACDGNGYVDVEFTPLTEADREEEDQQLAAMEQVDVKPYPA